MQQYQQVSSERTQLKVDNDKLLQTMKVKAGDTIMVPARIM